MSADTYLKIQTRRAGAVKGESTAPGHADEILLCGWIWGANASSAIGAGASTARPPETPGGMPEKLAVDECAARLSKPRRLT